MVLIDRKFIEEQLLLETFFPKVHIERDIRKKVISIGTPIKKSSMWGWGGVLICCLGNHCGTFSALKLLPAHFAIFSSHLPKV